MHSSIFITSLFAALAIASPLHQALHKKAYVYDVVTEIVTVTVTAGDEPVTVAVQKTVYVNPVAAPTTKPSPKTRRPRPTTSKAAPPPPPPAPTTTSVVPPPPPPVYVTKAPAPVYVAPVKQPEYVAPTQVKVVEPVKTSPPTAAGPSSNSGDSVKDACLNAHNEKRAKHHVGSLTWDDALASDAAIHAKKCIPGHEKYGAYGQNLYSSASSSPNAYAPDAVMKSAVASWYDESKFFGGSFGQSDVSNTEVLHFTQVVWKGTTKIGCAVNYCGNQNEIFDNKSFYAFAVTCNYASAGNVGGAYAANVFPA